MKNKRANGDFGRLKTKIFLQSIAIILTSVLLIGAVYIFLLSGRFADAIVALFQNILWLDYTRALSLYQTVFRNNMTEWFLGSMLCAFLVFFRFFISWFTRYFDEVNQGINALSDEKGGDIVLSPELAPVEKKINAVRQTLEKRELENKLSEQRKNELIVYLAHDIRTPLTSVIGYLNLLEEAPDIPAEQKKKYTGIALEKAYRLETLINQFFEISRYNLQEMVLEPERFDLHFLFTQLIDEFYPLLFSKGKTIKMLAPPELYLVGDAEKLARVFNNILRNAIAYGNPGSEIVLEATPEDTHISVSITNWGKTIPAHKLETIFERFYRLDEARSSTLGEAGLGLAIAKEIVALHSGKITASSENGKTVFTVSLPLQK